METMTIGDHQITFGPCERRVLPGHNAYVQIDHDTIVAILPYMHAVKPQLPQLISIAKDQNGPFVKITFEQSEVPADEFVHTIHTLLTQAMSLYIQRMDTRRATTASQRSTNSSWSRSRDTGPLKGVPVQVAARRRRSL
jgi:hypothetical protein